MPLGAARITLLARSAVTAVAEVIRKKIGVSAIDNAQVDTAQSYFGGASLLLDAVNDQLYCGSPVIPASDDVTIECWVRPVDATPSETKYVWAQYEGGQTGRAGGYYRSGGQVGIFINGGPSGFGTITLSDNTWHHLAWVRSGDNWTIYVDGVADFTSSAGGSIYQGDNTRIGARDATGGEVQGHIDEFRISDNVRYSSGFTPDTAPFVNDDNTLLLLHMDGTDASTVFEDDNGVDRSQVGFSAYNDAEISTDNSKFGGSSMYSPGGTQMSTADYIEANLDHGIGTGDFTVEWWCKWETAAATHMFSLTDSSLNVGVEMRLDNAASWRLYEHASAGSTFNIILNSNNEIYAYQANWNHFAWVRESGTVYLYVNGTKSSVSASYTTDLANATIMHIGSGIKPGYPAMTGYMDEVRVSNTARYTASFTAPTAPFTNDSDTVALLHMDGTDTSTDFRDDNGSRAKVGIISTGATIDTTYSKFGGSSFESTTANLAYGLTDQDFTTATDWTYEFWFRPSASVSGHTAGLSADSYLAGLSFYQNGTNMVVYLSLIHI